MNEIRWGYRRAPVRRRPNGDQVPEMGRTAGQIWELLHQKGGMSISGIVRQLGIPRDYVMEGIGWLAREGKIRVHDESRTRCVTLIE